MRAMVCEAAGRPLSERTGADPRPGPGQVLIRVHACGVCRTDLHVVDGDLTQAKRPVVPGHEIVGTILSCGDGAGRYRPGDRVGVPWLGWTCGTCDQCRAGRENLCPRARFTGYQIDGGYADLTVADERYCFPIPDAYSDVEAAPLLCAGLIGYRALRMAGEARRIGIYGFGAAAHIVAQVAVWQGREVHAFTRDGDAEAQDFARQLGAVWAGPSSGPALVPLDAALIFAPLARWFPQRFVRCRRAARWSVPAST